MNLIEQTASEVFRSISSKIRSFRQQQGLRMTALAKKAGLTASYLSQIESLKKEPTIGTLS